MCDINRNVFSVCISGLTRISCLVSEVPVQRFDYSGGALTTMDAVAHHYNPSIHASKYMNYPRFLECSLLFLPKM